MRAIDADALEELFREVIGRISKRPDINFNMEHMIRASAMVIEMIKDAPTIQPEIIRCKDCKYWDTTWQNDYAPNYHYCPMIDSTRRNDFYCADAERRTDG